MTTPPQPPVTPGPDEPYGLSSLMPTSVPPPRKSRAGLFVGVLAAVVLAAGLGIGAVLVVRADTDKPAAAASPSPSSTCAMYGVDASTGAVVCQPAGAAPVVNEGPTYATPTPADFTITVKILEKECFGSAGCLITYRIAPEYVGAPLDPSVTWLVTYEVRGVEDGPQINTFEVTGDEASFDAEESADTPSSKTKLTAKATQVLRG